MNHSKNQMIIKLNNEEQANSYTHGIDITANFISHAASQLKKGTQKKDRKIFFYHGKSVFGFIDGLRAGSTSPLSYRICKDKFVTENWLRKMNITTLNSHVFYSNQVSEAIDYVKINPNKKFVVKPINLSSGRGIIFNVDHTNIGIALEKSLEIQLANKIDEPSFIIQEFIDGFDVRICIAEGAYACALWRIPAHVVGNGIDTIEELVDKKNQHRKSSVYFSNFMYEITDQMNEYIQHQGYSTNSIPDKDELIFLNYLGNLQAGAESMDVSHLVGKELIELAVKTVASIPGLHTAGVDILAEDFNSDLGYVIEVNTNANNKVHYLPYYGEVKMPYVNIVQNMLVKYKVESGLRLTEEEMSIYKSIAKFKNYRETYQIKVAKELLNF